MCVSMCQSFAPTLDKHDDRLQMLPQKQDQVFKIASTLGKGDDRWFTARPQWVGKYVFQGIHNNLLSMSVFNGVTDCLYGGGDNESGPVGLKLLKEGVSVLEEREKKHKIKSNKKVKRTETITLNCSQDSSVSFKYNTDMRSDTTELIYALKCPASPLPWGSLTE